MNIIYFYRTKLIFYFQGQREEEASRNSGGNRHACRPRKKKDMHDLCA